MDKKKLPRAVMRDDGRLEVEGDKYPFVQGMIRSLATSGTSNFTATTRSMMAGRNPVYG
jgi:hypothetical protein